MPNPLSDLYKHKYSSCDNWELNLKYQCHYVHSQTHTHTYIIVKMPKTHSEDLKRGEILIYMHTYIHTCTCTVIFFFLMKKTDSGNLKRLRYTTIFLYSGFYYDYNVVLTLYMPKSENKILKINKKIYNKILNETIKLYF